jgi:transcriptional regulator with XRE-family HTH domain
VNTFDQVWEKLARSKKYRSSFATAQFKRLVPFQIRALRKHRGWSQEKLAAESSITQGVVSRAEDPDNGNLTVNTILSIAAGFDVAFVGRFVPFSELDTWFLDLSEESMQVPSFEDEAAVYAAVARGAGDAALLQAPPQGAIPVRTDEEFNDPYLGFLKNVMSIEERGEAMASRAQASFATPWNPLYIRRGEHEGGLTHAARSSGAGQGSGIR